MEVNDSFILHVWFLYFGVEDYPTLHAMEMFQVSGHGALLLLYALLLWSIGQYIHLSDALPGLSTD
jgi:hypothetical protein